MTKPTFKINLQFSRKKAKLELFNIIKNKSSPLTNSQLEDIILNKVINERVFLDNLKSSIASLTKEMTKEGQLVSTWNTNNDRAVKQFDIPEMSK